MAVSFQNVRTPQDYLRHMRPSTRQGYLDVRSARDQTWRKRWFVLEKDSLAVFNFDPAEGGTEQRRVFLDEINGLSRGVSSNSAAMRSAAHTHPGADALTLAAAANAVPPGGDDSDSDRIFVVRMSSGTMMLRAESADVSVDWMFGFQCAIVTMVLSAIHEMPDAAAVGSAGWQSLWQRQAAEAADGAVSSAGASASGAGRAPASTAGSGLGAAIGKAPRAMSGSETSLSMQRETSDGMRSISHGVIAAETARLHGHHTSGRVASPASGSGSGSGSGAVDFASTRPVPTTGRGARPFAARPFPPAAGARVGLPGPIGRFGSSGGRPGAVAASLPTSGSGLACAFGSPHRHSRPQPVDPSSAAESSLAGLFEEEDDETPEEEDAPTPSSGLGLGAPRGAPAAGGTPSPAGASDVSDASGPGTSASPASGLGAALGASQTAPQVAAPEPPLSEEDRRFLILEERFKAKCHILASRLESMQEWQRRTGRPVLGPVSKPTMRRGVSAPEQGASLSDLLFGPVKTEAEQHLGNEWQACADHKQPAAAAAAAARQPPSTKHRADKGAFGGKGEGVGTWGVWGCQGIREFMDDAHLSRPSTHPDAPLLAAERRVSLYGVFDGHSGCAAAEFVARDMPARLDHLVLPALAELPAGTSPGTVAAEVGPSFVQAFQETDTAFGRRVERIKDGEPEAELLPGTGGIGSGTTALVALVDHTARIVVVASVGDCRAIVAGTAPAGGCPDASATAALWLGHTASAGTVAESDSGVPTLTASDWPEQFGRVSAVDMVPPHSPGGDLERARITSAGGWVTHEEEALLPKMRGGEVMRDSFVIARMRRSVGHGPKVHTYRVCGELGVARALGDVNLKEPLLHTFDFNWTTAPDGQRPSFTGDLVTATPDVGVFAFDEKTEVMIVACDGLWDVISPIDAARAACEVLRAGASPKIAARRLAECAIHLGSTDNVTVLVVDLRAP
uniref:protein-serine/threonine phosphatase n=1 Tax=Cafeteria roenbergensis TaxID=33653 RepID=A0A7S0PBP7_CAFRO